MGHFRTSLSLRRLPNASSPVFTSAWSLHSPPQQLPTGLQMCANLSLWGKRTHLSPLLGVFTSLPSSLLSQLPGRTPSPLFPLLKQAPFHLLKSTFHKPCPTDTISSRGHPYFMQLLADRCLEFDGTDTHSSTGSCDPLLLLHPPCSAQSP